MLSYPQLALSYEESVFELKLELARIRGKALADRISDGDYQPEGTLAEVFETIHAHLFQDSLETTPPPTLLDSMQGDFSTLQASLGIAPEAGNACPLASRATFAQALAAFHMEMRRTMPYGDTTGLTERAFSLWLSHYYTGKDVDLDYRKLTDEEILIIASPYKTEGQTAYLEQLEAIFARICKPTTPIHYGKPGKYGEPDLPDQTYRSEHGHDPRLIIAEYEGTACIIGTRGELIPVEAVEAHLQAPPPTLPDEALFVPRALDAGYRLPDLPDITHQEEDGRYRYLDHACYPEECIQLFNVRNETLSDNLRHAIEEDIRLRLATISAQVPPGLHPHACQSGGICGSGKSTIETAFNQRHTGEPVLRMCRDDERHRLYIHEVAVAAGYILDDFRYAQAPLDYYYQHLIQQLTTLPEGKRPHVYRDGTTPKLGHIEILHELGYHTMIGLTMVPMEMAHERQNVRLPKLKGKGKSPRIVPYEVATQIGINVLSHMMDYIRSPYVDHVELYNKSRGKGEETVAAATLQTTVAELQHWRNQQQQQGGMALVARPPRLDDASPGSPVTLLLIHEIDFLRRCLTEARRHANQPLFNTSSSPLGAGLGREIHTTRLALEHGDLPL